MEKKSERDEVKKKHPSEDDFKKKEILNKKREILK